MSCFDRICIAHTFLFTRLDIRGKIGLPRLSEYFYYPNKLFSFKFNLFGQSRMYCILILKPKIDKGATLPQNFQLKSIERTSPQMPHCHFSSFIVGQKNDENFREKTKCDTKIGNWQEKTTQFLKLMFLVLYQHLDLSLFWPRSINFKNLKIGVLTLYIIK